MREACESASVTPSNRAISSSREHARYCVILISEALGWPMAARMIGTPKSPMVSRSKKSIFSGETRPSSCRNRGCEAGSQQDRVVFTCAGSSGSFHAAKR